jgi:hypothetical protein
VAEVGADGKLVPAFGREAAEVGGAVDARRLQRQLGQALADLGALDLEERRLRAGALAAGLGRERAEFGVLQRIEVDLQLGDLALEAGILDQRAAVVGGLALRDLRRRSTPRLERATPAMPERSWPSRYLATVQPLFSSPMRLATAP